MVFVHARNDTVKTARWLLERAKKQGDTSTASRLRKKLAKLKASVAGPAPDPEPERMQNTADSDDESECSRTGMLT